MLSSLGHALDLQRHRTASPRHFLMAMLAAGALPDPLPDPLRVTNSTFKGAMFGVHVECKIYALEELQWADVELSGGPFGRNLVTGRAWYEGGADDPRRICLDKKLEKTLRRYRITLVDVYPAPADDTALLLHIQMPMFGNQRMTLWEVPPAALALEAHRDLLW